MPQKLAACFAHGHDQNISSCLALRSHAFLRKEKPGQMPIHELYSLQLHITNQTIHHICLHNSGAKCIMVYCGLRTYSLVLFLSSEILARY